MAVTSLSQPKKFMTYTVDSLTTALDRKLKQVM
jgi:hypothetical protein